MRVVTSIICVIMTITMCLITLIFNYFMTITTHLVGFVKDIMKVTDNLIEIIVRTIKETINGTH